MLSLIVPGGLVPVASTLTDEDGEYEFCGLGPGEYLVQEGSRDGWVPTNSTEAVVTLTSGAEVLVHDFMNFRLGQICVFKYEDLNANGVRDEGEPLLPGWEILLTDAQGNLIRSGVTNEDGQICFTGLLAGEYVVTEILKDGWTNTTPQSVRVIVISGTEARILIGNFELVTLEIFKYEDVNGNHVFDNGDVPIGGWLFEVSGPEFPVPILVSTDPAGFIVLVLSKPGAYTISEQLPPGWTNTTPAVVHVTISSGTVLPVQRFGNMRPGSIDIFKFDDLNMNGIQDGSEQGLANFVYWVNGTLTTGGHQNFTRITNSLGQASVVGLPAGTYVVSEKLLLSPPGWAPTTPTVEVAVIQSGTTASFSFGNVLLGNITGHKFYDKDLDGIMDGNEPGLVGWTIILDGLTDGGVIVHLTTVTDATGFYAFIGIPTGVYEVSEILMPGFSATTALPVIVDVSGAQVPFEVVVNIGNIRLAEVHGHKFLDRYGNGPFGGPNGIFDVGESGIGNWEITLQGRTDTGVLVNEVRLTDNIGDIGFYEFTGLMPGRYWVNETLLVGFYATTPIANLIIVPSFPQGPFSFTINFGNTIPAPDPQIPFELNKGWNLWSMPIVVDGLTAKDLLKAIGSNGQAVTKLDKAADKYVSYVSGYADAYNFPIVTGQGYYVYVKDTVSFTLKGVLTGAGSIPVSKGWNIVGYNNIESTTASGLLNSVSGTTGKAVSWLDGQTKTYHSYVKGYSSAYDFAISPGRAYFLYVDGAGTLSF
jgi:hypothetical protein